MSPFQATFAYLIAVRLSIFICLPDSDCSNGFICEISGTCIDASLICDGKNDCPHQEDEPQDCRICIGDTNGLFGASFEYLTYNTSTKSIIIIYKNSMNDYYLFPIGFDYVIGPDYNAFSFLSFHLSFGPLMVIPSIHLSLWKYSCLLSGQCIPPSNLCDGTNDCYLEDDEEHCDVCIHTNIDSYAHFDRHYAFYGYNTDLNGSIYSNDSYYLYPFIYYEESMYAYFYTIASNDTDQMIYCGIAILPRLAVYFTMSVSDCMFWFVATESGEFVNVNITAEYCTPNISNNQISNTSSVSNNATTSMFVMPHWITPNDTSRHNITIYVSLRAGTSAMWDTVVRYQLWDVCCSHSGACEIYHHYCSRSK